MQVLPLHAPVPREFRAVLTAASFLIVLGTTASAGADGEPPGRKIPEGCLHLGLEQPQDSAERSASAEARWNRKYLEGVRAINAADLLTAQEKFCAALVDARHFGARDVRFAETLDELGLVGFLSGDLEMAEAMQGAAVAEMLLAVGPEEEATVDPPGRDSRKSSVTIYAGRLRFVYESLGRSELARNLTSEPYRIFERGYLPLDRVSVQRLDWLISQYLLAESFAAADWLSELRAEIAQ